MKIVLYTITFKILLMIYSLMDFSSDIYCIYINKYDFLQIYYKVLKLFLKFQQKTVKSLDLFLYAIAR